MRAEEKAACTAAVQTRKERIVGVCAPPPRRLSASPEWITEQLKVFSDKWETTHHVRSIRFQMSSKSGKQESIVKRCATGYWDFNAVKINRLGEKHRNSGKLSLLKISRFLCQISGYECVKWTLHEKPKETRSLESNPNLTHGDVVLSERKGRFIGTSIMNLTAPLCLLFVQ